MVRFVVHRLLFSSNLNGSNLTEIHRTHLVIPDELPLVESHNSSLSTSIKVAVLKRRSTLLPRGRTKKQRLDNLSFVRHVAPCAQSFDRTHACLLLQNQTKLQNPPPIIRATQSSFYSCTNLVPWAIAKDTEGLQEELGDTMTQEKAQTGLQVVPGFEAMIRRGYQLRRAPFDLPGVSIWSEIEWFLNICAVSFQCRMSFDASRPGEVGYKQLNTAPLRHW